MKIKIAIIDYGVGNVNSVFSAIKSLEYEPVITNDSFVIQNSDVIILPGVGAFDEAMANLEKHGLVDLLHHEVMVLKKPVIGICLGMQLMATSSMENGQHRGLGWIEGIVELIDCTKDSKVPHVGWNNISFLRYNNMFDHLSVDADFYFDHSYCFQQVSSEVVIATVMLNEPINAIINQAHIWGIQFHPEKSQNNGLKLLRAIIEGVLNA